jgi:multiple sugar transport system permease protein
MTDAAAAIAPKPAAEVNTATVAPEAMSWDSRARRVVTLYVPLACFVLILLFPFYWMAVTSFKPNAELYDFKTYNPFWIASPTLDHIRKLLFDTAYPRWVLTTMTVAVCATVLSLLSSTLAAYAIQRLRFKGSQ